MRSIMKIAAPGLGLVAAGLGALALAASLSACNNDYPIYGSIQLEKPGATAGPFFRASVGDVVKLGSNYYAQRSNIAKSSDGTSWSSIGVSGLGNTYSCAGLATDGTNLYAAMYGVGLYSTSDGTTWTESRPDIYIDGVHVANGQVFIVDHNENGTPTTTLDDTWTLLIPGGSNPTTLSVPTGSNSASIKALAYADGNYWAATDIGLYKSSTADAVFGADTSTGGPTGKIDSLWADGNTLYVGTDAGNVYMRTAGSGTWTTSPSLSYAAKALVEVPVSTSVSASGKVLLAGYGSSPTSSAAYGYGQLDPSSLALTGGNLSAVVTDTTNYDTTIGGKPVNAFLFDGSRLFAATASAGIAGASGLWTATWNGSSWSGWTPVN